MQFTTLHFILCEWKFFVFFCICKYSRNCQHFGLTGLINIKELGCYIFLVLQRSIPLVPIWLQEIINVLYLSLYYWKCREKEKPNLKIKFRTNPNTKRGKNFLQICCHFPWNIWSKRFSRISAEIYN